VLAAGLQRGGLAQQALSSSPSAASAATRRGRPSVSVPVLSKATTSMRCASSSASASLIRMPWRAATPVPAMMAVGVARPSAQGQAMTSTATAFSMRLLPVARRQAPAQQREQRDAPAPPARTPR
jgi:hypothetical protein